MVRQHNCHYSTSFVHFINCFANPELVGEPRVGENYFWDNIFQKHWANISSQVVVFWELYSKKRKTPDHQLSQQVAFHHWVANAKGRQWGEGLSFPLMLYILEHVESMRPNRWVLKSRHWVRCIVYLIRLGSLKASCWTSLEKRLIPHEVHHWQKPVYSNMSLPPCGFSGQLSICNWSIGR